MSNFVARRYRYANGICYNKGRYALLHVGSDQRHVGVGGALIVAGRGAIAYVGLPGDGGKIASIEKHYPHVWGSDLRDALKKIKPLLELEVNDHRL